MKVPLNYFESPLFSTNINFGYEVFWCKGKDTIDLTGHYEELNQVPYHSLHQTALLYPDKDLLLELNVYPNFFREEGVYKIRFTYKAGMYNEGLQDVSTSWIYLNVKKGLAKDK